MRAKWRFGLLAAAIVAVFASGINRADAYTNPVGWSDTDPSLTHQTWTFDTSANPVSPNAGYINPNGTPSAAFSTTKAAWVASGAGSGFVNGSMVPYTGIWGTTGVPHSGDTISTFTIPVAPAATLSHVWVGSIFQTNEPAVGSYLPLTVVTNSITYGATAGSTFVPINATYGVFQVGMWYDIPASTSPTLLKMVSTLPAGKFANYDYATIDTILVKNTWKGIGSTTWSTASGSNNWITNSGSFSNGYESGAIVTFDDTASANLTVNIATANVSPGSVAFVNTTNNYVVTGSTYGIAGTTDVTKEGTGTVTLNSVNSYTGVTTVKAGTLQLGTAAQAPVMTGAGGADIQGGKLVLDYTGTAPNVLALLDPAYDTGWTTGQIRNTTAGTTGLSLGWKQDATTVTVMATYAGDANLDGAVNGLDLDVWKTNVGSSGAVWAIGDFNYDGAVNGLDLDVWKSNVGSVLSGAGIGGATVPEPGMLVLLLPVAVWFFGYVVRRRRQV